MGNTASTVTGTKDPIKDSGIDIQEGTLYTLEITFTRLKKEDIKEILDVQFNMKEGCEPDFTEFVKKMLKTPGTHIEFGRFKESGFKFDRLTSDQIENAQTFDTPPFPKGSRIHHTEVTSTVHIRQTKSQEFVVRFFVG